MKVRKGSGEEIPLIQDKEQQLHFAGAAVKRYPTFKVRKGSGEEIALFQGKEQRLCFARASVKRYLTSMVRETEVRW